MRGIRMNAQYKGLYVLRILHYPAPDQRAAYYYAALLFRFSR